MILELAASILYVTSLIVWKKCINSCNCQMSMSLAGNRLINRGTIGVGGEGGGGQGIINNLLYRRKFCTIRYNLCSSCAHYLNFWWNLNRLY